MYFVLLGNKFNSLIYTFIYLAVILYGCQFSTAYRLLPVVFRSDHFVQACSIL